MTAQKTLGKSLRRKVASFLSIFITALLCLLAIIYSSPWGTQASITLINKFTDISLTYEKGMFSKEIEFSEFFYNNKDVNIYAKDLTLQFHLRCLWQKQLCINTLAIEHLSIKTQSTSHNTKNITENNTNKAKPFEFPLSIKVKNVSVQKIELILAEYAINFDNFNSSINIKKSIFTFNEPIIQSINITSVNNNNSNAPTPKIKTSTVQLPEIKLPITLKVVNLSLNKLSNQTNLLAGYLPEQLTS